MMERDFPGLRGRKLQDAVWERWALNKQDLIRRPYYGGTNNSERNFERHIDNDRHQEDTVEEYACDIEKDGVRRGLRGDVWVVAAARGEGKPDNGYVLSGMTLIEAFYRAYIRSPQHEQVVATCAAGCLNITIFDEEPPGYVCRYLVHQGNEMVGVGSQTSHIEKLKFSTQVRAAWEHFWESCPKKSRDASGSQKGFEKLKREKIIELSRTGLLPGPGQATSMHYHTTIAISYAEEALHRALHI